MTSQLLLIQDALHSIQKRFTEGGSFVGVLVVILLMAAVLLALSMLQRLQTRRQPSAVINDPRKLFHTLLKRKNLGVVHRDTLRRMTSDLRLTHPAIVLLGPGLFRSHVDRWCAKLESSSIRRIPSQDDLDSLCQAIFGQPIDVPPVQEQACEDAATLVLLKDEDPQVPARS